MGSLSRAGFTTLYLFLSMPYPVSVRGKVGGEREGELRKVEVLERREERSKILGYVMHSYIHRRAETREVSVVVCVDGVDGF